GHVTGLAPPARAASRGAARRARPRRLRRDGARSRAAHGPSRDRAPAVARRQPGPPHRDEEETHQSPHHPHARAGPDRSPREAARAGPPQMSEDDAPDWKLLHGDLEAFFGLPAGYGRRELKLAYAALIKIYKPEQRPEEFQLIRAAYDTLEARL